MNKHELNTAREEQQLLFMRVLGTPEGERLLGILRDWVRYDLPVFTAMDGAGRIDTHRAAWLDGRRSVYRDIAAFLETPPPTPSSAHHVPPAGQ